MFWSEQQQRNAQALRDRATQQRARALRMNFILTSAEAAKELPGPIEWIIEYERKADERQAAWEASPFFAHWCDLASRTGSMEATT